MPVPTSPLKPWLATLLAALSCQAGAMVLGGGSTSAVMGVPLDFTVPVRGEGPSQLVLECVLAEVTLGERKLPPTAVRTLVEPLGADAARVRVQTRVAVDEPVLQVTVSVGCDSRVSRRYTLLAEPPGYNPPGPVAAAQLPEVSVAAGVPGAGAAGSSNVAPNAPALATAAPAEGGSRGRMEADPRVRSETPSRQRTESIDPSPAEAARREQRRAELAARLRASRPVVARRPQAAAPAPATAPAPAAAPAAAPRETVVAAAPTAPTAPAGPRLRLETSEPAPKPAAASAPDAQSVVDVLLAASQAASAAHAAAAAASAAAGRVAALELSVEKLRSEAANSRDMAAQLRDRLARSEASSQWVMPLIGLALALAGITGWLAMRLGAAQKRRQQDWQAASKPTGAAAAAGAAGAAAASVAGSARATSAPMPFVTADSSSFDGAEPSTMQGSPRSAWPPAAPLSVDPWSSPETADTQPLRPVDEPAALATAASLERRVHFKPAEQDDNSVARDVSIEELIDLEQQAEFFVVLGQDDAAVDLLVEHLRSTGGGSPLPYLKLLEIYRRRGEREPYERSRARFNHRFNAYAPEWGSDLLTGASLEDYPGIIPRLQQVWDRPLDAMAELEALLFRKSRGELFDLPAYREVLFLYSIARDLLDREAADTGSVDFLLPMSDGSDFGTTAPQPYYAASHDNLSLVEDDRPTEPLDLDVSGSERRTSIFGQLDEPAAPPPPSRPGRPPL